VLILKGKNFLTPLLWFDWTCSKSIQNLYFGLSLIPPREAFASWLHNIYLFIVIELSCEVGTTASTAKASFKTTAKNRQKTIYFFLQFTFYGWYCISYVLKLTIKWRSCNYTLWDVGVNVFLLPTKLYNKEAKNRNNNTSRKHWCLHGQKSQTADNSS
jgi:hypothetical protein